MADLPPETAVDPDLAADAAGARLDGAARQAIDEVMAELPGAPLAATDPAAAPVTAPQTAALDPVAVAEPATTPDHVAAAEFAPDLPPAQPADSVTTATADESATPIADSVVPPVTTPLVTPAITPDATPLTTPVTTATADSATNAALAAANTTAANPAPSTTTGAATRRLLSPSSAASGITENNAPPVTASRSLGTSETSESFESPETSSNDAAAVPDVAPDLAPDVAAESSNPTPQSTDLLLAEAAPSADPAPVATPATSPATPPEAVPEIALETTPAPDPTVVTVTESPVVPRPADLPETPAIAVATAEEMSTTAETAGSDNRVTAAVAPAGDPAPSADAAESALAMARDHAEAPGDTERTLDNPLELPKGEPSDEFPGGPARGPAEPAAIDAIDPLDRGPQPGTEPTFHSAAVPDLRQLAHPEDPQFDAASPQVYETRFVTTRGAFTLRVYRDWAPLAADRFYQLSRAGFYNNNRFFRVVPGFVAQWGIHGFPSVATAWRNAAIPDEPVRERNRRGTVSFAAAAVPDTRTTQVFVNLSDNAFLDDLGFAPFAEVIDGMDVVEQLFSGYGEAPSQLQRRIQLDGNAFLDENYPDLDGIVEVQVSEEMANAESPK